MCETNTLLVSHYLRGGIADTAYHAMMADTALLNALRMVWFVPMRAGLTRVGSLTVTGKPDLAELVGWWACRY